MPKTTGNGNGNGNGNVGYYEMRYTKGQPPKGASSGSKGPKGK